MDFVSHALWGGVSFGRKNKTFFLFAAGISILPDVLTEGLFVVLHLLNIGGMPGWENGHPNITDFPAYAQNLYNITHSFLIFAFVFALFRIVAGKPVWIIGGWGLHILIDIPTHSLALFPTPFLWPVSEFKVDGIAWDNPVIFAIDIMLLIAAYSLWLYPRFHQQK
jgi:membrane-bound metal-dependent hydrolase YbcI (DUF457 family)